MGLRSARTSDLRTTGQDVGSVRLTFANDIMIEDTIDDGWVLFSEPHRVVTPAEVVINDGNGDALVTCMEFVDLAASTVDTGIES
jgi:hypothetical protein